jgi:hypothetical protein
MGTRWKIEFDARLPSNPEQDAWKVGIPAATIDLLQKRNHHHRQARILLIEAVLSDPAAIFEGWSRPEKEDCFVYAGNPGCDYYGACIEVPPPPGMIFLVFVLPDGTIDEWNWRPTKSDAPTEPQGIKGRKIWPQA